MLRPRTSAHIEADQSQRSSRTRSRHWRSDRRDLQKECWSCSKPVCLRNYVACPCA